MTKINEQAVELLRLTIDRQHRVGWVQHRYANLLTGEECLVRSLSAEGITFSKDVYLAAAEAIELMTGTVGVSVFNDFVAETQEDIILACKRAIEYLEEK